MSSSAAQLAAFAAGLDIDAIAAPVGKVTVHTSDGRVLHGRFDEPKFESEFQDRP